MAAFTHFSKHAYKRIAQRTLLSYEEIALILDQGHYINTGMEPGFNREHLVFYSHKDENCFVAIRDHYTGTTVTVLPMDYHKNLAWAIPESALTRAKEIYPFHLLVKDVNSDANQSIEKIEPRIHLTLHFIDINEKRKSKPLLKLSADITLKNLRQYAIDAHILDLACAKAAALNIPIDKVTGISAKIGKRDFIDFFGLDELGD